jgi:hypothetical protein
LQVKSKLGIEYPTGVLFTMKISLTPSLDIPLEQETINLLGILLTANLQKKLRRKMK